MKKKVKKKNNVIHYVDIVFSILLSLFSISSTIINKTYSKNTAIVIGVAIILSSLLLLIRNKNDKKYIILFAIILYVNISLFLSDILTNASIVLPQNTLSWQTLRNTNYEIAFLNCINIFITILNCISAINTSKNKKINKKIENTEINNKNNIIIFALCYLILIIGLVTGYKDASIEGNYMSATSTLYEYCIIFTIFAWYYAGKSKGRNALIIIYSIIYIIQSIVYGDRSSAFPMVLLIIVLYFRKLSIKKLLLFAIAGIMASNIVATYRESYSIDSLIENYETRYSTSSLTSDTVSQSYYTGITKVYTRNIIAKPESVIKDYTIGIIAGGKYGNADLTTMSSKYKFNRGGGMAVSDFYYMFGYIGVIIEAIIVSLVIEKLKYKETEFSSLWKICLTVMVFRWYLYSSFVFFRTCIFVFLAIYISFNYLDKLIICRRRRNV